MATPFQYTPDEDAEIDRRARRYLAEEAEVAKLKDREERAKVARESQARENLAGAAAAMAKLQRPPAATGYRSKYTGPVANRGVDAQGRALVSREELVDFQRKYGADKTLRDLLNADRGAVRRGAPTSSATDMRARGVQGANLRTEDMYAAMRDKDLGRQQLSPEDEARNSVILNKDADFYRKGGKVKTYAKGGSVRGGGCEQRGLRKCKVY